MTFVRLFDNPGVTQEQYDAASQQIGVTPDNLPEGGLLHVAGPGPHGGWRVVEIWESEQAAQKFDEEQVEPVLSQVGIQRPAPDVWQVHNLIMRRDAP
jgi:hypothetical protein